MKTNRRSFLKYGAWAAAAPLAAHSLWSRADTIAPARGGRQLNCAQIGCGSRSAQHLQEIVSVNGQTILALVDPDPAMLKRAVNWLKKESPGSPAPRLFSDYRRMFEEIGKNLDAVFIAAPNHHHAVAALMAMEHGINVFCEKPLCHEIAAARTLREAAARYSKVTTQTGIQGHCEEGYRKLCEYLHAGVIGRVTETHSWTNRSNGGVGSRPQPEPPPPGMDWDNWIGPAPFRAYHADLHPHAWHGWHDFGNGSLGNMGSHILDGVFWALEVGQADQFTVEAEYLRGGTAERYPTGGTIRWEIPARGTLPPLKIHWYEGLKADTRELAVGYWETVSPDAANLPPRLAELKQQYPDEQFGDNGTLYVGEHGTIYTGTYGERLRVLPAKRLTEIPKPAQILPRPGNVFTDFIRACQDRRTNTAVPFDYGSRLTEFILTGNLAQAAGPGRKLEWDVLRMQINNHPELNPFIQRKNRPGWLQVA